METVLISCQHTEETDCLIRRSTERFCKTLARKIFDISNTDFSFPSVCFELCPEGKLVFLRGTLLSWRTALRDNWFLITLETDDMKCSTFFCRLIKYLGGSQPGYRRGCISVLLHLLAALHLLKIFP